MGLLDSNYWSAALRMDGEGSCHQAILMRACCSSFSASSVRYGVTFPLASLLMKDCDTPIFSASSCCVVDSRKRRSAAAPRLSLVMARKDMSGSIQRQLPSVATGAETRESRRMAASQQKRGERNREIDPLLARALERLRRHMVDENISQYDLAKATGLTQGHISKLLGGKSPEASFYVVARLAIGAGVSIDWLVSTAPAPAARVVLSSAPPPSKTG
jgi:hypothetical protein